MYNIHNFFDVEVIDTRSGLVRQQAHAENIVLNQFFTGFLNGGQACTHIQFGRGTGTPDVTRTALFSKIGHQTCEEVQRVYDLPVSKLTAKITLAAASYVGETITEVGFGIGSSTLMTHAMLQDSEGNPISITKTDTDIIIIKGTFYCTAMQGSGCGENGAYVTDKHSKCLQEMLGAVAIDKNIYFSYFNVASTHEADGRREYIQIDGSDEPDYIDHASRIRRAEGIVKAATWTFNSDDKTMRSSLVKLSETESNNKIIKAVGCSTGFYNFPNHDLFPPQHLTGLEIGAGDGETTTFNIQCPIIMEGTEKIYVNGVLQTPGVDYAIYYENNCIDAKELYESAQYSAFSDNVEVGNMKTASFTSYGVYVAQSNQDPIAGWWVSLRSSTDHTVNHTVHVNKDKPILFNFLKPVNCNTMKFHLGWSATIKGYLSISYSDNGVDYTPVSNLVVASDRLTFDMVKAQYWKIETTTEFTVPMTDNYNKSTPQTSFGFGICHPGLIFTNPPTAGATITADYDIEYPFKTANNIMQFQCTKKFGTGEVQLEV